MGLVEVEGTLNAYSSLKPLNLGVYGTYVTAVNVLGSLNIILGLIRT